jgi:hypothetical protein
VTAIAWLGFVVGVAVVLGTLVSVMVTLVVPRGLRSRLAAAVGWGIRATIGRVAGSRERYEDRDRILSLAGPAFVISLLATWVLVALVGFGLMFWPFTGPSLPRGLEVAGSSMFTLGFAVVDEPAPIALMFLAAAVGLSVVALQIAYLPTLYAAFNRRELLVTLLESRGGVPSWGPEILARHELIDNVSSLADLYARWEEWAADLAESHSTYQALVFFRSPNPLRSWITGLLSVLDAAALHLSLNPLSAPPQARPFMRMGYMALREMARVLELPYNPDPKPEDPVQLTREEFDDALAHLAGAGWRSERDADEAWIHFRGWRVTYEQTAWAIADRLEAPPALWSGPRRRFRTSISNIAPERPPHREPKGPPKGERAEWRELTDQRRSLRNAGMAADEETPEDIEAHDAAHVDDTEWHEG